MTCESCDGTCSAETCETVGWHKVMDRAGWEEFWSDFDAEPTHEKWRRGARWR
jgi:hypothetical protein